MIFQKIILQNFRNYKEETINFDSKWNILIGHNGAGKTNILEAIYYTATSKSPRGAHPSTLIQWEKPSLSVCGEIVGSCVSGRISHKLLLGGKEHKIKLNDIAHTGYSIEGMIPVVYFIPEDVMTIKGEASGRRKMLDFVLVQSYPNYKHILRQYRRVILERNTQLRRIRERLDPVSYLEEWDAALIKIGIKVYQRRKELIEKINKHLLFLSPEMFSKETIQLVYAHWLLSYHNDVTEEDFHRRIEMIRNEEIQRGITICGPHRDDVEFLLNDKNLKQFGSQGQQRAAMLCFKCASARLLNEMLYEEPIILFDDVFSELDDEKKAALLRMLQKQSQMFFTTTSIDGIKGSIPDAKVMRVENGKVYG